MPLNLDKLAKIAQAAAKAAPEEWWADSEHNEGEFGVGPDTTSGFSSWVLFTGNKRLADAQGSDAAMVRVEYDEDGGSAFDETSDAVFAHLEAFDPPTVLRLLADRAALLDAAKTALGIADRLLREEEDRTSPTVSEMDLLDPIRAAIAAAEAA